MNPRTKKLLTGTLLLLITLVGLTTWGVVQVVAWARELPNRIVIDGDALGDALAVALTESFHQALTGDDVAAQRQALASLQSATGDEDALQWVRDEYHDDILALTSSTDEDVAADAKQLLAALADEQ